jgi:hypothetical protein
VGVIGALIGLVIGVIFVVNVVVPTLKNANTSGWSTTETSVYGNISLLSIVGLLVLAVGAFGLASM